MQRKRADHHSEKIIKADIDFAIATSEDWNGFCEANWKV